LIQVFGLIKTKLLFSNFILKRKFDVLFNVFWKKKCN
jgi:hypothetical protein